MHSKIIDSSSCFVHRAPLKDCLHNSLEEPVDFDVRTEFLRDEGLSSEEEKLIVDEVAELRRRLEPEITKEKEKSMEVQTRWQLYLGLCIIAAATFGIILMVATRRKWNRRRGQIRVNPGFEIQTNTGLEEPSGNRPAHELRPSPDAFGVTFPLSSEWDGVRDFLKSHRPGNLQGDTLYLDDRTIDSLRGYGYFKPTFVDALCTASSGILEPIAPSVGDSFDLSTMERDEQLSGECKVTLLISPGLRETKTGRIVCKAFVSVC